MRAILSFCINYYNVFPSLVIMKDFFLLLSFLSRSFFHFLSILLYSSFFHYLCASDVETKF